MTLTLKFVVTNEGKAFIVRRLRVTPSFWRRTFHVEYEANVDRFEPAAPMKDRSSFTMVIPFWLIAGPDSGSENAFDEPGE